MMAKLFLKNSIRILLLLPILSFAQTPKPDTSFLASSIIQAKKLYAYTAQGQAQLYNGEDYIEYKQYNDEHPYFLSDDWELSTVEYSGELFENVPILYDISSDQLISEHFYSNIKMQLIYELVGSFTFQKRQFVKLIDDGTKGSRLKTGFYEQLYTGKVRVYAKHSKSIQKTVSFGELVVSFEENTRYYILKNNTFYEVNSTSSMLQVLSDKKKELKHFMKENHLRFKSDKDKSLIDLTTYYDSITR